MITLGIESTAHTFGVGIIEDEEVLVNLKSSYSPKEGGIHPRKASEHHYANAKQTLNNAIQKADIEEDNIDLISFSQGPGIPQCLDIGAVTARALSLKLEKPLIGVNHCIAHIEIGKLLTESEDPVTLYVSGGNSQILAYSGKKYRIFGETQDIAIGNALDKFARTLGIPHPGGPEIENLAEESDEIIELPYVVKGNDFSFSGLVTELQKKHKSGDYKKEKLCNSFQEYGFSMLIEATERAMAHLGKKELLLTGGVAANKRLKDMCETMCKERGAKFYSVPFEYASDNGAMIAYQGYLEYKSGKETLIEESAKKPNWRTNEVKVNWI